MHQAGIKIKVSSNSTHEIMFRDVLVARSAAILPNTTKELAPGHNWGQTELERTARDDCRQEVLQVPSRGSATPSDCGTGSGGGGSGQMADTHMSNWLLAVAQRLDEIRIRHQALMEKITVLAEESARLADEPTESGLLAEAAREDFNATLTGAHDVQTLKTRVGAMEEIVQRQDRCTGRVFRPARKLNANVNIQLVLIQKMLALTAEVAHFYETNPVAARHAGGTETNLPQHTGRFSRLMGMLTCAIDSSMAPSAALVAAAERPRPVLCNRDILGALRFHRVEM